MGTDAKHVVRLTVAEWVQLEGIVADSRAAKARVLRSRMLHKAYAEGTAWPDSQIAEAFEVNAITMSRLRKRCVWEGLDAALVERPRSAHKPRKLDGAGEAQLIAKTLSEFLRSRDLAIPHKVSQRLLQNVTV